MLEYCNRQPHQLRGQRELKIVETVHREVMERERENTKLLQTPDDMIKY
jgi:hypothetical protein